jgi:hypothetical protein
MNIKASEIGEIARNIFGKYVCSSVINLYTPFHLVQKFIAFREC